MNAARRSVRRRDWPRGLYEVRPGYFVWRAPVDYVRTHPGTPAQMTLGQISASSAVQQAIAANTHCAGNQPTLLDQLQGKTHTVAELVARMPVPTNKGSATTTRSVDKRIVAGLGKRLVGTLTVKDCADFLDTIVAEGVQTQAGAVRARMSLIFRKGMALGWMTTDPAAVTKVERAEVKRQRLTLDTYRMIFEKIEEPWLRIATLLALITGQDRSTVAAMKRSDVMQIDGEPHLIVQRSKTKRTNMPVAIPLALRLDVIGMSLAEALAIKTGIVSPYYVHHTSGPLRAKPVSLNWISDAFAKARNRAGITDENPPTFHELRSLSKRLYLKQGNVNTKDLLSHKSESAAQMYADARGVEFQYVKVGLK